MRVILYDASTRGPLGWSWAIGSKLNLEWVSFGVKSWDDALGRLPSGIKELQIWGHGVPAAPLIDQSVITDSVMSGLQDLLSASDSLVWFRSCSVFFGSVGAKFALRAVRLLKCRVAAHTHTIGFPWHSGLYTLRPGGSPSWPLYTGKSWESMKSGARQPHTIGTMKMSFPKGW
jgi:hypothetical protein